ncbi:MAG: hypothetical protein WC964_04265 [Acholeplasmataceae bacterium]
MIDETLYHQFANWKLEYSELLRFLSDSESILIDRFKQIIGVVDYMYDKLIDDANYNEVDHEIFQAGFFYLHDQVEAIDELLKKTFKDDYQKMNAYAKEINLLLNTIDFQNELLGFEGFDQDDMDQLIDFEEKVLAKIKNLEQVPIEMYQDLDLITIKIFEGLNVDFRSIPDIFFNIAEELGII